MTTNNDNFQLDPVRVCDAAEAMMCAAVDYADGVGVWPGRHDLLDSDYPADVLARFSRDEITEAATLLDRFGVFESRLDAA